MVTPVMLDILIVAVLLLFVLLGSHRGFVLTLCSLVAVIVALVGANILADAIAPKAAELILPHVQQAIRSAQHTAILDAEPTVIDGVEILSWLDPIKEKGGLYAQAVQAVEDALDAGQVDTARQLCADIATTVATRLAHGVIFLLSFLIISVAWFFISHALDLVSKLPILDQLNHTLGGAMGLVKGLVVVYIAAWVLCALTGTISPQLVEETHLLRLLTRFSPLDLLTAA